MTIQGRNAICPFCGSLKLTILNVEDSSVGRFYTGHCFDCFGDWKCPAERQASRAYGFHCAQKETQMAERLQDIDRRLNQLEDLRRVISEVANKPQKCAWD